jgi:hypothetical protein
MRDVRAWLKEGDPLNDQPGPSADDMRMMRQVVVAAANESMTVDWSWPRPWMLATAIGLALAIGISIGTRLPHDAATAPVKSQTIERRQIQFETPAGTRIIWVLSSDFTL